MSAFRVPAEHLDALLTAALSWARPGDPGFLFTSVETGTRWVTEENASEVGAELWLANHEVAEWDDPDGPPPYAFSRLPGEPDPVTVLCAVACFGYQTAGDAAEEWLLSDVKALLDRLAGTAASRLPGYDDVPWPVRSRDVFLPEAEQGGSGSAPGQEP